MNATARLSLCFLLVTISRLWGEVIDVGTNKQLFIDKQFVTNATQSLQLRVHQPARDGRVLIGPDQSWEKGGAITVYSSAMKYKGKVRIWYDLLVPYGKGPYEHTRRVCYAESRDGLHFVKPTLGLHKVNGSKANNVVLPGVIGGCSVWIDPKAAPAHRFKSQSKVYPTGQFHMHSSPDGVQWKFYKRLNPGPGGWDTQSIIFWDKRISRYVMFTRRWVRKVPRGQSYRTVRRAESTDFVKWTNQSVAMEADKQDLFVQPKSKQPAVDFYGADVFIYEGVYVMLAQRFWHWQRQSGRRGLAPSTFDVQLATSRDGIKFQRPTRQAFMATGPDGRFDSRFVWALPHPVRMGDELWIYYSGVNRDHDAVLDPAAKKWLSGIGVARLRLDGFASVSASGQVGEFTTPPLRFSGKHLQLNVNASGGGFAEVGILDESGKPIPGFSVEQCLTTNGNSVRRTIRWRGGSDLSPLAGKTVQLQFRLRQCDLYAFQFVP